MLNNHVLTQKNLQAQTMNTKSLHIGIIGCSAEGAALCFKTICTESEKRLGLYAHPEVSMHTHSLADYVDALNRNDTRGVADLMLSSAHKLKQAGADFLICPDNTIHLAFSHLLSETPLPWLHIAETVAQQALKLGFSKLGILGTKWLVESQVYPEKLSEAGLQFLIPNEQDRAEVSRIIMDELVYGECSTKSINYYQELITKLKHQDCDAVVLACTEIPLIINDQNSPLPTLNSNYLLAMAAIEKACYSK